MIIIEGFILVVCIASIALSVINYIKLMEIKLQDPVRRSDVEAILEKLYARLTILESSSYSKDADQLIEKLNKDYRDEQDEDLDNIF